MLVWRTGEMADIPDTNQGAATLSANHFGPNDSYYGSTTGSLENSSDADRFQVSLLAGRSYTFLAHLDTAGSAALELELLDSVGNPVQSTTAATDGEAALSFTAPANGTYYLRISAPGQTGSYELDLLANASTVTFGTPGNDTHLGSFPGGQFFSGGDGDDFIVFGSTGYHNASGGNGSDTLSGDQLDNALFGGFGNDVLIGGAGNNILVGGAGDDFYVLSPGNNIVDETGGSGNDTVSSGGAINLSDTSQFLGAVEDAQLTGSGNVDAIGNGLANRLSGNSGNNVLSGGGGNDILFASAGSDTLIGGNGDDVFVLGAEVSPVITEASGTTSGSDTVTSTVTRSLAAFANVENLDLFGTTAIAGTGNSLANRLDGSANTAANVLTGLAGDDLYIIGAGDTVVEAVNKGVDLVGSYVSHRLEPQVENLTLLGSAIINGIGNALANVLNGSQNSAANILAGLAGDDRYVVGAGDTVVEAAHGGWDSIQAAVSFTLGANVEELTLVGSAGISGTGNALANKIDGSHNTAANLLKGLAGNDTYIVGAGDRADEAVGGGKDLIGSLVSYTLGANLEDVTLLGAHAIAATGNALANTLNGTQNAAANVLKGLGGDDTYFIGGRDVVIETANSGADLVVAKFSYALTANVENLILDGTAAINGTGNLLTNQIVGNSARNVLSGAAGNDLLKGMAGADVLVGGLGNDTLYGGAGHDFFVLNAPVSVKNADFIVDFSHADDTFRLENAVMSGLGPTGPLQSNLFYTGDRPHDPDDRIIYDQSRGALFYDDDGIGAHPSIEIAALNSKPLLAADDFVVI